MSKNLVVVESPAKAKTIQKYLGKDFEVLASYGHVRDLVPKEGAVDPDRDFAMKYEVVEKHGKYVDAIAKAMAKAAALYLATDQDREGEAISWHLCELLKARDVLNGKPVHRVVFNEITQRAISEAIAHPRDLSSQLISAQQARRALDYLVGFSLSPLLWRKISRGLSAGRVQSPALRMIVEREEQIEGFESQEYWSIEADGIHQDHAFSAKLVEYQGEKITQFSITDKDTAHAAQGTLWKAANGKLQVDHIEKKQRRRNPSAPFTTSTLQQEASRKLGFTTQRTMRLAQQLYEGIDVGAGAVGLITYMRTDSVHLASDALDEIRALIAQRYGKHNVPAKPRVFKTKTKNAQEAHEAIRPTGVKLEPDAIRDKLTPEQYKLYDLIWKRTVASQMQHATLNMVAVTLGCGAGNAFRATGSTVADPGFMLVYKEDVDDATKQEDSSERVLPAFQVGDLIALKAIRPEQHFTEPPPRFTEASLVKALEEFGIGRPSTYVTIISTLQQREYVVLEDRRFRPTDMGKIVSRFLTQYFNRYVDYDFTARLEDELDAVSRGEKNWVPLLGAFWKPFKDLVDTTAESVTRQEVVQARELGIDPVSGRPVSVRMGRYGPFVQIGTKEDEEKPKFAGLRAEQRMDTVTLEEALALFQLPRELGETPEGEPILVNIGRFGPYVRYGQKYVSIKEPEDPYTLPRERALELITEHKTANANKIIKAFEDASIQVLKGRYGPYITDGKKNARIPKDREPATLTKEECETLLQQAPERKPRRRAARKAQR
jgi:DNA topoisomerase-1